MKKSALTLRRMTVTAVLTALAVVLKCFTKAALTIPGLGLQVSFGGIFTFFPAALFGPLYGGAASALCDFLGAMIAPTGAYIPWLTLTAFLSGFLKGLFWKLLMKASRRRLAAVIACLLILVGAVGFSFSLALQSDGVTHGLIAVQTELPTKEEITEMTEAGTLSALSKTAVSLAKYNKNTEKNPDGYRKNLANYLNLLTGGLMLFALIGLFMLLLSFAVRFLQKKRGKEKADSPYMRILTSVLLPGFIETTLNTYILKLFISAYAGRSLLILWIPRVCEEFAVLAVQALLISVLWGVLANTPAKKYIPVGEAEK